MQNVGAVKTVGFLRIRSGPGTTNYREAGKLYPGNTRQFSEEKQGQWVSDPNMPNGGSSTWYRLADGSGWVSGQYIKKETKPSGAPNIISRTPASATGKLNTDVNFRTYPYVNSSTLIGLKPQGTTCTILEKVKTDDSTYKDWYYVQLGDKKGYLYAPYVDKVSNPPGGKRITDAVNKVNPDQWYYRRRDITGDGKPETFCNWFAADVLECLGVPIPRQTNSPYKMNPPVFGGAKRDKPISAEQLYTFFNNGGGGKWQKVSAANAAAKANNGQAVVASSNGHIAIVIPGSSASNVRIAQAGWNNGKNMGVYDGFGNHPFSYFAYVG